MQLSQNVNDPVLNHSLSGSQLDIDKLKKVITDFSLGTGPIDVSATHDFYDLQIAFENVWTELFDSGLASTGETLYNHYNELKESIDPSVTELETMETINDINRLMDGVNELQAASNIVVIIDPLIKAMLPELTQSQAMQLSTQDMAKLSDYGEIMQWPFKNLVTLPLHPSIKILLKYFQG